MTVDRDLPTGWRECCQPIVDTQPSLTEHICGVSDPAPAQWTAGYQTQFSLNLTPTGNEDGHLVVHAALARSAAAAAMEFAAVNTNRYKDCVVKDVDAAMREYYLPPGTPAASTTAVRGALPIAGDVVVDHLVTVAQIQGRTARLYTSVAHVRVGRFVARVEVNTFDGQAPQSLLVAVIESLTTRSARLR